MNRNARRILSWMLVLALCISLAPAVAVPANAATVQYVTGSTGKFSNVVYNWGTRGTTATFLSPMAEEFYGDIRYEDLASLDGGTGTSNAPASELYAELADLMESNHKKITSYDETRELYAFTDCQNSAKTSTQISSFYSGTPIGPTWDGGKTWNREHAWPNSKGLDGNDENDIMMLRPTASIENSSRGNTAYGESSSYYDPNDVSNGAYNLHGDVARIMLYVYVRWGNTGKMWGSAGVMESLDVLLDWMEEDPVDTWEMGRNDSVQSITGTRNVFVDYPELAFLLFGQAVPEMTTPSGEAAGSEYTITATVNDPSMGNAVVNGRTITIYPKDGYETAGYTLASGNATVIASGNILTVDAESDCTIHIAFRARTAAAVTYYENGAAYQVNCYAGDVIKLPEYSGVVPEGYSFLGWVTESLAKTAEKPEKIYLSGEEVVAEVGMRFYSLLSSVDGGGSGTGLWTLVTDASKLKAGEQVVLAANGYNYVAGALSGTYLKTVSASFAADKKTLKALPEDAQVFTLGGSQGAWTFTNSDGKLLYSSATKNLNHSSGVSTWTITITAAGAATIKNTNTGYAWIQYNAGAPRFTTYSSSQVLPQIYMLDGITGTLYYSTGTCDHENTSNVAAVAPSCSAEGYTAGVICDDCGVYVSGHTPVAKVAHSWDEGKVILEATFEDLGEMEYTCDSCGETRVETYEKPLIDLKTSMTLADSLSVAFVLDITLLDEDGAYAVITKEYADGREAVTVEIPQEDWKEYCGDLYYFAFEGVAAKEMCDQLTVEVYNTFGSEISNPYTDSIQAYAMRMLEKDEVIANEELRTLYVDMLNYGAAAQTQFDYNAENLANAQLTEAQKAWATTDYTTESNLVKGPGRVGTTLTLKNRITLDFIFSNDVMQDAAYAVASYTDHYGEDVNVRIETIRAFDEDSAYVSVPGLAVADYGAVVTCQVYDAEGNVIAAASDSIEGYAHRMAAKLPAMVESIIKFGVAAYNYFH